MSKANSDFYLESDRLKRYVESGGQPPIGNRSQRGPKDEDARSTSTAFASQVNINGYD